MTKRSAAEELAVQVLRRYTREVVFQLLYQDDLNPGLSSQVGEDFLCRQLSASRILQFAQENLEEFLREGFADHPLAQQPESIRRELERFVREGFDQWTRKDMVELARRLTAGVRHRRDEIDAALTRSAEHWALQRMAPTDRNVLRLGAYELLYESTPDAVVLDEAVELARRFGGAKSPAFVNGILDRLRREHSEVCSAPEQRRRRTPPLSAETTSSAENSTPSVPPLKNEEVSSS